MNNSLTPTGEGASGALVITLIGLFLALPGPWKLVVLGLGVAFVAFTLWLNDRPLPNEPRRNV